MQSDRYHHSVNCIWTITAPDNMVVGIKYVRASILLSYTDYSFLSNLVLLWNFSKTLFLCASGLIGWIWKEVEVASLIMFLLAYEHTGHASAKTNVTVSQSVGTEQYKQVNTAVMRL